MNNRCGLVSISFRGKTVEEIIQLCKKAGLGYIEWGSDVHCPVGDIKKAKMLCEESCKAGLITYCYGSYFRVGVTDVSEFCNYCDTAKALGAKTIRVWAYNKKRCNCNEIELNKVINEAKEIGEIAKKHGLYINFEYHRGCLTETIDDALQLFNNIDSDCLRVHWQPNPEISEEENIRELESLPRVDVVHVFAWTYENGQNVRHPLCIHKEIWKKYIQLAKNKNPECIFELEFFKDDSDAQALLDTEVLKTMYTEA